MTSIGLIGCGRWGKNHAKVLASLAEVNLTGISDVDREKATLADTLGVPFYADYRHLAVASDAVVVAVPTAHHYEVVQSCLDMGKHVLVEKPVTLSSKQTEELVDLAEDKKLILSVGYIYRFHPVVKRLKELLDSAGDIHYITARYVGGQNQLWDGSGAILNFGIHFFYNWHCFFPDTNPFVTTGGNCILSDAYLRE